MTRLTVSDQEERTQQKTSHIVEPGLANKNPALREVDLEPSAKRETGVVTPKDKTKSNTLANQKVRFITKSVVSFSSLPVSLTEDFTPKELQALKHGTKMSKDNKSAS